MTSVVGFGSNQLRLYDSLRDYKTASEADGSRGRVEKQAIFALGRKADSQSCEKSGFSQLKFWPRRNERNGYI